MDVRLPNGHIIRGVPEGTSKEAIKQKAIAAGLAVEADFTTPAQQKPIASQFEQMSPPQDQGGLPLIGGEARRQAQQRFERREELKTRAEKTLPEIWDSGIFAGEEEGFAHLMPALMTVSDPEEFVSIAQEKYPHLGKQYDEKGNVLLYNPKNQVMAMVNKPGLSKADLVTLGTNIAAYSPAGRATTVPRAAMAAGGTGAAIEATQAASGGTFDPIVPILDATLGAGGQKIANIMDKYRSGVSTLEDVTEELTEEGVNAEMQDAIKRTLIAGDREATALMTQPQREIVEAGETLGLKEPGLASAVSGSPEFIAQEQAEKSIVGSPLQQIEDRAVRELQERADKLIEEFGGTLETTTFDERLKAGFQAAIDDLDAQAVKAYDELAELVPKNTPAETSGLAEAISEQIENFGGDVKQLSGLEKRILGAISRTSDEGQPIPATYQTIDKIRKLVGEQINKKETHFKRSDVGELKRYYGLLTEAQERSIPGLEGQWQAAKSLVRQRKELEDNAITAYGKEMAGNFMPKFGEAAKALGKKKTAEFDKFINAIPPGNRKEVVTSALNDVFTLGSRKEKQLNIAGFADWYNALKRDPALKKRIWRYLDKDQAKLLDAMGVRINGLRNAISKQITTGRVATAPGALQNFVDGFGKSFISFIPDKLRALGGMGLSKIQDQRAEAAMRLLSDPNFIKDIKLLVTEQADAAERRIVRRAAYKNWLGSLGQAASGTIARVGLREYLINEGRALSENAQPQEDNVAPME